MHIFCHIQRKFKFYILFSVTLCFGDCSCVQCFLDRKPRGNFCILYYHCSQQVKDKSKGVVTTTGTDKVKRILNFESQATNSKPCYLPLLTSVELPVSELLYQRTMRVSPSTSHTFLSLVPLHYFCLDFPKSRVFDGFILTSPTVS